MNIPLRGLSAVLNSWQDLKVKPEATLQHSIKHITEIAWHMIIGGTSGSDTLRSVELYNWQTGEQCYLADLPEGFARHTGAIFEGVPVVCGGTANSAKADCYDYNIKINTWSRVNSSRYSSKRNNNPVCLHSKPSCTAVAVLIPSVYKVSKTNLSFINTVEHGNTRANVVQWPKFL